MKKERLSDIFKRSPQEALEEVFKQTKERLPWSPAQAFLWQSRVGIDGVRYGSYRTVLKAELEERRYKLEFFDGAVSILWVDVTYDPCTRTEVHLEL